MEIYMGIFDSDATYSRRLMSGLINKLDFKVHTVEFTGVEAIVCFAESKPLELLLIERDEYEKLKGRAEIGTVICLYEKRIDDDERLWAEKERVGTVFKYQPLSLLTREIMAAYHEKYSESGLVTGGKELVGVYSPIGRCGKTRLSLALAIAYGERKPTLFVSFEEYADIGELTAAVGKGDVVTAMYYFLQGDLDMREKELICQREKFDYLYPASSAEDLRSLRPEEVLGLLKHFLSGSIYSRIVVDLGHTLPAIFQVLSGFDRIYMPVTEEGEKNEKLRKFMNCLSRSGMGISDRVKLVRVPEGDLYNLQEINAFARVCLRKEG